MARPEKDFKVVKAVVLDSLWSYMPKGIQSTVCNHTYATDIPMIQKTLCFGLTRRSQSVQSDHKLKVMLEKQIWS